VAYLPHARTAEPRKQPCKVIHACDNGNCVSVDECYSSLLGNSRRANELPR
jgi:hypothetical protein